MFIMSANAQSFQSIHCFHTQMWNVDESLDQYLGIYSYFIAVQNVHTMHMFK